MEAVPEGLTAKGCFWSSVLEAVATRPTLRWGVGVWAVPTTVSLPASPPRFTEREAILLRPV